MTKILVVDDEKKIVDIVTAYLIAQKFEVEVAYSGTEALTKFYKWQPNLVVLDLMLPDLDGNEVTRRIRQDSKTPIIMLTAKSSDESIVNGLQSGADDYVVKPFSPSEVMARVRAVLRRMNKSENDTDKKVLSIGDLTVNIDSYTVFVAGEKLAMTKKEVETMWILAGNPSKVFTRDNLLDSLWGQDYFGDSRTVDSHIKRLRAKLDKVEHPGWEIKTIWGLGYKFEVNL